MASALGRFFLDGDKLPAEIDVARFEATEGLSEPYSIEVEFTTTDTSFHVEDCLRTRMCLGVTDGSGQTRLYDGIVDRARLVRVVAQTRRFEVRLVPAIAALSHREGCRIFQAKTIVQVIQQVFKDAGFADKVDWHITKTYAPREFIVQYRETHLNFVSRLLEEGGLFYFFLHTADGHKMIVTDDVSSFGAEEGAELVQFSMAPGGGGVEPLQKFTRTRSLRATSVDLRDYDFVKPEQKPQARIPADDAWPAPYFEYPGGFTDASVGSDLANARLRELRADADVCRGEGLAVGLRVGAHFSVSGAAEDCLNGEFVTTRLVTRGSQTLTGGSENTATKCEFHALPKDAPFAAPRRAKKPRIRGVQTAIVTGSSKQEQAIHVDEHGRIKVRFYWDREGQQDHTSSMWIRVSQAMMGDSMILPRVGWEVSVAFLDGDPDRPIVLGRTYNAEKTPPMSLPGSKASGSLKSMSSPGAGGHNEITAGDTGGSQGLSIHAQKDFNVTVGHDKVEETGVNEDHTVKVNENTTIKVNETISVTGHQSLDVGSVLRNKVTGDQKITVKGNDTSNAISNFVEKIDSDRSYSVGGTQITISNGIEQSVTGDFKRSVGSLQLTGTLSSINDSVVGNLTESSGAVKVQLVNGSVGEKITKDKNQTYAAAELHLTKGALSASAGGSVTNLVGGLHYQKLDGGYAVKAPMITLLGAVGIFKGGSSELKLGGGPVVIKGDTIAIEAPLIVKMSTSMKLGS